VNRFAELIGDDNAGRATLLQNGTYIAMNRRGLKGDGRKVEQGIYVGATIWWGAVTAALPHVAHEIVGPSIACRLGSYTLKFFGASLVPFGPEALAAAYGSFEFAGYRACVQATVDALVAERLYDPRVESARELAERARALFLP
jgi:hypothetical protein